MKNSKTPVIIELADKLEMDIRKRKLKQGASYMNAAEVAKFLSVSGSTANRALQILASRDIVSRARKRGTIINNLESDYAPDIIKRVQMITFMDSLINEGIMSDPVVVGIQERLPRSSIQFNFLPRIGYRDHLIRLLDETEKYKPDSGVVLTRAAYTAQKILKEKQLPSLVHGYTWPSVKLSSITMDYGMIGRLCGEFCLKNKIENVVIMLPMRPIFTGDYKLQYALMEVLAEAGYPLGSVHIHSLPLDYQAVHTWLKDNYAHCTNGLALICYPELLITKPWEMLQKMGIKKNKYAFITIDEHGTADISPHLSCMRSITSTVSATQMGVEIADMLISQAAGKSDLNHRILPVEISQED